MLAKLTEMWERHDAMTKLMIIGVVAMVVASVAYSYQKVASAEGEDNAAFIEESRSVGNWASELTSEDALEAVALAEILTTDAGQWEAIDDDLCVLMFEQSEEFLSFQIYDGDLRTGAFLSFNSIESTESGWRGEWHVAYEDGGETVADFEFSEDSSTGLRILRSEAFSTYEAYRMLI